MCKRHTCTNLVQVQGSSGPLQHNKCCLNACGIELGAVLFSFLHHPFHWSLSCFSTIQLSPLHLLYISPLLCHRCAARSNILTEAPGNSCGDCAWVFYMGEALRVAGLQGQ